MMVTMKNYYGGDDDGDGENRVASQVRHFVCKQCNGWRARELSRAGDVWR